MSLNLHHVRLFAAVAQHASFTRAAAALNMSQPAVSKALGELERQVGLPLFDRTGRAVRLTDAGEALYARARELFGIERAAEHELREMRGLERGLLRVGASTTIATYLLPPLLGAFHAGHPRVELRVSSANTRAIVRMLLEWRIDVALVEGPVSHPRIEVRPWKDDELVVIGAATHPLIGSRAVPVKTLVEEQFIVREPGSGTREVAERALAEHGVRLRRTMRIGGTEAIKQAVAAGLGLAIVSRAAAADQLALGRIGIVVVEDVAIRRTFTRLRLRGSMPTASARAFEELLDDAALAASVSDASGA
jgi:DNA-binding transcriptional LysR family regulator